MQNLVDEGRITADEAQTHPQRSLVTRVLTGAADDEPDLVVRQGRIGDRYVISSDGLTDYVARDTIDEVLTTTADPGDTADRLVALALRAGAPDNVTVVVGDLVDLAHQPAPPTQPQVVGAAADRQSGTRPIPTTPAAKAAALTQQATGGRADDDGVTLAEEGPRSRRATVLRLAALARRARRRRRRRLVRRLRVVAAAVLPRRAGRRGRGVPRGRPDPRPDLAVQPRVLHDDRRRRPPAVVPGQPAARASTSTTAPRPTPGSPSCGCRPRPAGGPSSTARCAAPCRRPGPRRRPRPPRRRRPARHPASRRAAPRASRPPWRPRCPPPRPPRRRAHR